MNLNCGFFKFQFCNRFVEKVKITQIHPRSVLNLQIDFKDWDDMDLNWGFL